MMAPEQLLLVAGILLVGGVLVIGGAWLGLRARRQGGDDTDPLKAAPAEELSQPKREPPAWLSELQRKLPPDTILLSRDPATSEWLVELEGQRYRRLGDVHDDKAAAKILDAIEGIKAFAGLAPAAGAASPAARVERAVPPPGAAGYVPRRPGQPTFPAPEGSIIAQIEAILQKELALHADLDQRSIHMGATPDGSLLIEVDHEFYKSPDELPEARVRDIVMQAVRTWEKSSH